MSRPQPPRRLTTDLLLQAYRIGYFPMAEDRFSQEVFWVRPDVRGIIPLDDFHISRSLKKAVRQDRYRVTVNKAFNKVIEGCAMPQSHRWQTWINAQIMEAFQELHRMGLAHSIETWDEDQLVGGLYGVSMGAVFFGESMFSTATDASKVALVHLVARLRAGGYSMLDAQFQTGHLKQFGTVEVEADDYHIMLQKALEGQARFDALDDQMSASDSSISGSTILQSITQTS